MPTVVLTLTLTLGLLPGPLGAPLVAPLAAQAEDDFDPTPGMFSEVVDVQVVNVEVRVSDRKGRPITGLGKDDFTLYEDGERVEITYFTEVTGERVDPAPSASADPVDPTGGVEPAPEPVVPAAEARHFVIFLDLGQLTPAGMNNVFDDLRGFVENNLRPEDRVMVVERQQNLRMVLEPTTDHAQVSRALAELAEAAPQGLQRVTERRNVFRQIRFALEEEDSVENCTPLESMSAEQAVAQHAGWIGGQVLGSVSALTSLVRALSGIPGDKAVLYVAEGLEQRPAVELFHRLGDLCPVRQQEIYSNLLSYDLSREFHRLAADANANRVTFYPLDAGGLRAGGSVEGLDQHVRLRTIDQRMRESNLESPLYQMAEQTGGRAIFDTNRFDQGLEEISEDVDRYYSLGFVPEHQGDGKIHRLRVELDARHHDLRFRKAYRDKPQPERIVEAMLGALLFGVEANPLDVRVESGEARPAADGRFEIPVRIRVPLDSVVLTPGTGFSVGRLRLVLVALEPDGDWTSVRQRDHPFKVEGEGVPDGGERVYEVTMELPPGDNLVAVGVRDEQGGEASYLRLPVAVSAAGSDG